MDHLPDGLIAFPMMRCRRTERWPLLTTCLRGRSREAEPERGVGGRESRNNRKVVAALSRRQKNAAANV